MSARGHKKARFSSAAFVLAAIINFAGIVILEITQIILGLLSFTDNVSSKLDFVDAIYWVWSPLAMLTDLGDSSVRSLPSPVFVFVSIVTMGTLAGIVFRRATMLGHGVEGDDSTEKTIAEREEADRHSTAK